MNGLIPASMTRSSSMQRLGSMWRTIALLPFDVLQNKTRWGFRPESNRPMEPRDARISLRMHRNSEGRDKRT